jgi:hypothetical protein
MVLNKHAGCSYESNVITSSEQHQKFTTLKRASTCKCCGCKMLPRARVREENFVGGNVVKKKRERR